jgi:hypothetical protein
MIRILLIALLGLTAASAFQLSISRQILGDKCCTSCSLPLIKYFSLSNHRCGEACLDPKDYVKYKIFEPGLTKAETNSPCPDRNYPVYNGTYTHEALGLKGTFDMYLHPQ